MNKTRINIYSTSLDFHFVRGNAIGVYFTHAQYKYKLILVLLLAIFQIRQDLDSNPAKKIAAGWPLGVSKLGELCSVLRPE